MTRLNILLALVFMALFSCGQHNSVDTGDEEINEVCNCDTTPISKDYYDTSIIAMLHVDKSNSWLPKGVKTMGLNPSDLIKIDQLLADCINTHNLKQDTTKQFSEFIDLKKYKRQYIPFIDSNGERKVFINCFCTSDWDFVNWEKDLVQVDDGGSCFFQVIINLTKAKYENFFTNGYA